MNVKKLFVVALTVLCLITTAFATQAIAQETGLNESNPSSEKHYIQTPVAKEDADYVGYEVETGELHYFDVEVIGERTLTRDSGEADGMAPPFIPPVFQQTIDDSTIVDPLDIIGPSTLQRITPQRGVLPYSAIAVIEIKYPDGETGHGTAWMFYGDVAITAGHCVYNAAHGGWAKTIKLYAGPNGTSSSATITADCTTMYTSNLWISSGQTKDDWGVLKLNKDVAAVTGYLGISYTTAGMAGTAIEISGYPWKNDDTNYQFDQYHASGTIRTSETALLTYTVDTLGGQSGAPIFLSNSGSVVGIHGKGMVNYNQGARITPSLFDYLLSFRE